MSVRTRFVPIVLVSLVVLGCNRGPTTHVVSGRVTFDNEPVEMGEIIFESTVSGQGEDSGRIKKGEYRLAVREGSQVVRINGSKAFSLPAGEIAPSGGTKEWRQFLPAKFNSESTLKLDVTGPLKYDFDLQSK